MKLLSVVLLLTTIPVGKWYHNVRHIHDERTCQAWGHLMGVRPFRRPLISKHVIFVNGRCWQVDVVEKWWLDLGDRPTVKRPIPKELQ